MGRRRGKGLTGLALAACLAAWSAAGGAEEKAAPVTSGLGAAEPGVRGSLAGRVVGPDGEPVPGARLLRLEAGAGTMAGASSRSTPMHSMGSTDAGGRFAFTDLPAGRFDLAVMADGYLPAKLAGLAIPAGRGLDLGDVALARDTVIEGSVTDAGGAPVLGMEVSILPAERAGDAEPPGHPLGRGGVTGAGGRFRENALAPGRYVVRARGVLQPGAEAEVDARPGVNRVDLRITGGSAVAGRVLDAEGKPIAGAAVDLREDGNHRRVVTGSDGSFRIPQVPAGEYGVTASKRGYAEATVRVDVGKRPVEELTLRLAGRPDVGPAVAGRLLGLSEQEQREVTVSVSDPDIGEAQLDGKGGYTIADLPPGTWQINASTPGGRRAARTVRIDPMAPTAVFDLDFRVGGSRLTGRVTADGRPLAGAMVRLGSEGTVFGGRFASTGSDGRFEIEDFPPGHYVLLVRGAGGLGQVRAIDPDEDLDLEIAIETAALGGRVIAAATGQPIAGATMSLTLYDEELETLCEGPVVSSDETGSFHLAALALGAYRLKVEADGYTPADVPVSLDRAGARSTAEVRLHPR